MLKLRFAKKKHCCGEHGGEQQYKTFPSFGIHSEFDSDSKQLAIIKIYIKWARSFVSISQVGLF